MGNAAKNKGKKFEREVADFLSKAFNLNFKRSITSGAFTGGKNQFRTQQMDANQVKLVRGDIIPPDNLSLVVECKNHREFSSGFNGIIAGNNLKLNSWLNEVLYDSENNKIPNFLVFKITDNTGRVFFALPTEHFNVSIYKGHTHTYYINQDSNIDYVIIEAKVFLEIKDKILACLVRG